ncbi:U-box domain-containing protein 52 isoform X1 [Prunus yedoensis var. nudiflora]|uniref:U-box domain-containing protein 52 isoform X1 n=1 Tax=Prunus yedoensis var. nudiflora TaxID=2094558 RepID=A0A314Y8V3_PRUYE|nr:U-box domain-containing protein 52 isoform X1 [Prunus yedoensis var. nudiflora]
MQAVGKDDTDVLKWTLDNAVSPGTRVFLVHVFPPITYIPTPVGRLAKSRLTDDQVRLYINEESNKRRNLLQKYVSLCNDAKVWILLFAPTHHSICNRGDNAPDSKDTAKAILDLIPVLSIIHLVIGTKRPPHSRLVRKKLSLGEFVRKNAPDFCEVSIVHEGKKVEADQQVNGQIMPANTRHPERCFFACFPGKNILIDSALEDQDILSSSNSKSGDKDDQTNSVMHCVKWEGQRLKFMTEMKWEGRRLAS